MMQRTNLLLLTACCLLPAVLSSCQSVTPGMAVNKTNPRFLKEAGVDENVNPHKDGVCKACHSADKDLLNKEVPTETEVAQRKLMRTDPVNLCVTCHKASLESEHVVGIETKLNRNNLPLDHQGNITCATTCHDVHSKDLGLMLRHPFDTLCLSCHDV